MARLRRGAIGGTFHKRADAERAAGALRARKIKVEIEKVACVHCPGGVREDGWVLGTASEDVKRAVRILDEAGYARFLH